LYKKPKLELQTTTLWEYPSQHYGAGMQGDKGYKGATPSYVIWNLLQRYTRPGDVIVDPMCGSGTTVDVAADLGRKGVGFDIAPYRPDIKQADARKIPLKSESVDFVFVDPPYSTHLKYSGHPQCIGELDAADPVYYEAMGQAIGEMWRILKNRRYMALYVSDSWKKGEPFQPIGFDLFALLRQKFKPIDIVAVVRHNKTLKKGHWHKSAMEGNYYLRGFNYLFIMKKEEAEKPAAAQESPTAKPAKSAKSAKPPRSRRG
jgi:DNA modification methylase